ncbi:putative transcriptional regulatory protein C3C7.04 like [Verticillium longisporum]|uniref:Putative transcriptional regulatory protein C3C7.04 like n=1 Tax=Verticillium longisporum TaxID=100787 RepID=A0A8I2ZF19_VERLO|nr:putative transcriptional regulatory protein C3C7.04 like [Verticillium longisporum]
MEREESAPAEPQPGKVARSAAACHTCRSKKVKCSGSYPCRYCSKRNLECQFPGHGKRKLFSVSDIQNLEDRLHLYEQQSGQPSAKVARVARSESEGHVVLSSTASVTNDGTRQPETPSPAYGFRTEPSRHGRTSSYPISASHTTPSADPTGDAISSSYDLRTDVRSLLASRPSLPSHPSHDDRGSLQPGRPSSHPHRTILDMLPPESDAAFLVETLLSFVGVSQQFFDPRDVLDQVDQLYENPDKLKQDSILRFCETILVLAVGIQFAVKSTERKKNPGIELFDFAMGSLPSVSTWRATSTPIMGILGLAAVYLQNLDRKDDAYFYVTTESPLGIEDDAITIEAPFPSFGFQSPDAININVSLARVSGQIYSTIYGCHMIRQDAFVIRVQAVMRSLHKIARSMPSEFSLDFGAPVLKVTRTAASLHLMLYQPLMYAARPLLLRAAKGVIGHQTQSSGLDEPLLQSLIKPCLAAARRSLMILTAMQNQGILAMYGFFDLDAIFSAAFSVILDSVMNTHARTANSTWLNSACHLLLVMGECGNAAAASRRVEILRICEHLSLPFEPDEHNRSIPGDGIKAADAANRVDDVAATLTSLRQGNLPPYSTAPPSAEFSGAAQTIGMAGLTDDTVSPFAQLEDMFDIQAFLGSDEQPSGEAQLSEHVAAAEGATIDDGDFSWLYQDSDFALTGADMTDWEVFGRYLNLS